ncbi:GNAT family N-acetyltransferase [Arthrobacter sp. BPSS-3]|uniref:GNAT family N-acetyltransferase n=1 Tax=Arthrobacter sp. BPSS-3 TaxID=3366580 RepID=UPI0037DD1D6B
MGMGVGVRPAVRKDQEAIGRLISPWDRDNGWRYRERRGRVSEREFVAEDGDGILGWISGSHRSGAWGNLAAYEHRPESWVCSYIVKLYVDSQRQSGGMGSLLLGAFEADAMRAGRDLVVVHPDETGDVERLIQFYRNNGYNFMEPSRAHSMRPAWLMAKTLRW